MACPLGSRWVDCAESVRGRHSAADGRTVPARGPCDDPGKRRAREEDPVGKTAHRGAPCA